MPSETVCDVVITLSDAQGNVFFENKTAFDTDDLLQTRSLTAEEKLMSMRIEIFEALLNTLDLQPAYNNTILMGAQYD